MNKQFYKYGKEPKNWIYPKYGTDEHAFYYFTKYFYGIKAVFIKEKRCIEATTTMEEFKKLELEGRNISTFEGIPVHWKIKNKKGT